MKTCSTIEPTGRYVQFHIDVDRANLCQWVWGFIQAWWRNETSVQVTMHQSRGSATKLFENGVQVYPPVSAGAPHE